ncbi:hypothetical protein H257_08027 [Aphanomyces astaci]|uniref:Alpha-type protein kinase domain-containing protein n=1 Tax=Aphanomyces astaci TaxID=112090 RepID=W4GFR0_APHAT|nr:hypothetical protein H257_08027 [Aphanomyces astaci]ETV78510.1 hypothetical protein H257_08027 [Aphanomyces astaci]|eukprot:XP_009832091.1 hypothetical protein H257_08027 [Aphanomyces astaci]
MGDSVFNLENLQSELNVGPSAYFPPSFTRGSSAKHHTDTAARSFQRRDAITSIAEHEEWNLCADDVQTDLDHTLQTIRSLKATSMGNILQSLQRTQEVHLAFVMDTTGSMDEHLDAVKNQVSVIAASFQSLGLVLHVGFLGYKDHGDDNSIQAFPFTDDVAAFQRFVQSISAGGGDDAPEDVLGGLWAASTQLPWQPDCTNVLFHIGDAPPHGTTYWGGYDLFPYGHPRDQSPATIFGRLEWLNVRYYFGKLTTWTDMMVSKFQTYTDVTVFNVADPINVCSSVVTATQQSVVCNRTRALVRGRATEFAYKFDTRLPQWPTLKTRQVTAARYECDPASLSAEDLSAPMSMFVSQRNIRIAPHPFARGCERAAFYSQALASESLVHTKTGATDPSMWGRMVAKRFLWGVTSPQANEGRYMKAMEVQAMAAALARGFNDLMNKTHSTFISLTFLEASVAKLDDPVEYVAIERFLPNYDRFTNNVTWQSPLVATDPCVQYAVAFSHWTWAATNGYLMVVDLQGQRVDEHTLVLTDPAIHCIDGVRFAGGTNMGQRGMEKFFTTHVCNEYCAKFKLTLEP